MAHGCWFQFIRLVYVVWYNFGIFYNILDEKTVLTNTGKSLSEAHLYDEHGENMLCTKIQ